jgi:hypothetical protein
MPTLQARSAAPRPLAKPAAAPSPKTKVFVSASTIEDYLAGKVQARHGLDLTEPQATALGQWRLWRDQGKPHCAGCRTAISAPRRMVVEQSGEAKVIEAYGQKWLHAPRRYFALCQGCGRGTDAEMIDRVRRGQLRGLSTRVGR